MKILQSRDPLF